MNEAERLQKGEGSKFNSALADLERIDRLLRLCNQASTTRQYDVWCSTLNALYRELAPYMNATEREAAVKLRLTSIPKQNASIFHYKLDGFEIFLRDIRAKKKLGIVAEEDASTAALR